jgi:hypothetical protein
MMQPRMLPNPTESRILGDDFNFGTGFVQQGRRL